MFKKIKSNNSKRRSLDELTNISLNFDMATNNSINTTLNNNNTTMNANNLNNTLNNANNAANISGESGQLLNSSKFDAAGANPPDLDEDSVVFDELAFLCSGQFKMGKIYLTTKKYFLSSK